MGSTSYPSGYTLKNCLKFALTTDQHATRSGGLGCIQLLAKCVRGNIKRDVRVWAVWQYVDNRPDDRQERMWPFISVIRFTYDSKEKCWTERESTEADGPIWFDCPLKYLKMTPVASRAWREAVIDTNMAQALARKVRAQEKQKSVARGSR
jgi:hypothetical protein